MTAYAAIRFERAEAVARITFNRPEQLNALDPILISEALSAVETVAESDARVLVVTGAGKAFSAGVDLKAAQSFDRESLRQYSEQACAMIRLLETMPQITIARVDGYCFTGGLEIALGCDFIIASETSEFADTHAKLGLSSGWGMTQRLPRRIGWMKAKEISVTCRRVGAREALALGLILDAVPADQLDGRIDLLAQQVCANSGGAIAVYKAQYRMAQNVSLDEGLENVATKRVRVTDNRERQSAFTAALGRKT